MSWLLRASLRFQWSARYLLVACCTAVAAAVLSGTGLVLAANHKLDQLAGTVDRKGPAALRQALSQPLHVQTFPDGSIMMDNPLRYWFESARAALGGLDPAGVATNTVQVAATLLPPLIALFAAVLVTRDHRSGTLRIRATRFRFSQLHLADLMGAFVVSAGALLLAVLVSAGLSPLLRAVVVDPGREALFGELPTTPWPELLRSIVVLLAVTLFSVAVGVGLGLLLRRVLVISLIVVLVYFAVPVVFAWDPRNLWITIWDPVFRFDGIVSTNPPIPGPSVVGATGVLLAIAVLTATGGSAVCRRLSRY